MGIALPHWIVEGRNNIWVLSLYALAFGGALPLLVVRHLLPLIALGRDDRSSRAAGGSAADRKQKMACMDGQPLHFSRPSRKIQVAMKSSGHWDGVFNGSGLFRTRVHLSYVIWNRKYKRILDRGGQKS